MNKYIYLFLISMVPLIELRGGMLVATAPGTEYNFFLALIICIIANMLPVPFIYFFARKVLIWGADKKFIGKFFTFCLEKGEKAGNKLVKTTGRGGLFIALMLFVGIPLPGTGAWTGTLGASFLKMGFRSTVVAVCLGVILAGLLVGCFGTAIFSIF
ncbi:MAG: small multi-drug export protein [Oscillospiraceae bacterium]|nr:small multi-drug export protein [Oscillospiraceae bacterium]